MLSTLERRERGRDTAYKIFKGEIAAPINVSIFTAFTVAGDIAKKS